MTSWERSSPSSSRPTGETMTEEEVISCGRSTVQEPKVFFGDVRATTGKIEKPKLRKQYSGMEEAFKIK